MLLSGPTKKRTFRCVRAVQTQVEADADANTGAVPYVRGRWKAPILAARRVAGRRRRAVAVAVAVLLAGSGPTSSSESVTPIAAIMCALLAYIQHEHVWHALCYSARPKLSYVPALLQCTVAQQTQAC